MKIKVGKVISLIGASYRKVGEKCLPEYQQFISKPPKKGLLLPDAVNYKDIGKRRQGPEAPPQLCYRNLMCPMACEWNATNQ